MTTSLAGFAGVAAFALAGGPAAQADPGPGYGTSTPSPIVYTTTQQPLVVVGVTDLSAPTTVGGGSSGGSGGTGPVEFDRMAGGPGHGKVHPLLVPHGHAKGSATTQTPPASSTTTLTPGTYPQTIGFPGISSLENSTANGYSLEPPDQGLCVGDQGNNNATVMEVINNSLQAFSPSGAPESQVIPTTQLFGVTSNDFLSDPRCYWDRNTRRWFFTEFDVNAVSTQYIAVSQTDDALGKYTVFAFDTTDSNAPAGYGCPCFGDFDQIGADLNGFYITTNEFNDTGSSFNGTDIWAMSKTQLADAADLQAPPPPVDRYAVTADQFGPPYHVSPSQTPPDGSYFPNTELFVESNSDAATDNHLMVYAMTDTKLLDSGAIPPLAASYLTTQSYSQPPNALQNVAGSAPTTTIDTDFNAIQEVTESHGTLWAELDSGGAINPATGIGAGPAQAEWFILSPDQSNPLSVQLLNQGAVSVPGTSLMYPDLALDGNGDGYLIFSASGPNTYPSPGYMAFDKYTGPDGPALMPTTGVDDENGFTCYPPFGTPGSPFNDCRWGDYSMGVSYENRIFMSTEYIPPPGTQDAYTNWGTYIWDAPDK